MKTFDELYDEQHETITKQAEQIQALSDEVNRQRNNEKGRKPSCLINLDLRKELERLKEICEKQDDYIDRICAVAFHDIGADMYKEIHAEISN